jgi:phosphinothricin acetyltransferase
MRHPIVWKESPMKSPTVGSTGIRPATVEDADAIARIYNHFIRETVVTFEEEEIPSTEIVRRMREVEGATLPWLVAVEAGEVLGYAYAGRWKERRSYRFSVEVTVYLAPGKVGHGTGSRLYEHLLPALGKAGTHVAVGGITLPNAASVGLHEKFGFGKVAHFREVGFKFGRWLDVGYWQRTL